MLIRNYHFTLKLKSWILDFLVVYIVAIPFVIIELIFCLNNSLLYNSFLLALLYSIIICKDLPAYQSFGKYKARLKVVDLNNNRVSTFKLILRNIIFILIWPIEFVVNAVNTERRLGDLICGTKVIKLDSSARGKFTISKKNILYFLLIIFILSVLFYSILGLLIKLSNVMALFYS